MSNSGSRHKAREAALQILYSYDLASVKTLPAHQFADDLTSHFDHFKVPKEVREFAAQLVAGTLRDIQVIDETLEKHATNWKVTRMAYIDRALLRMAVFELLNFPDIPSSVTIDEAIELAKDFGAPETPAFINGILDSIKEEKKSTTCA